MSKTILLLAVVMTVAPAGALEQGPAAATPPQSTAKVIVLPPQVVFEQLSASSHARNAVVGLGFDRLNGSESGVSVSANGFYAAVGGGASLYLGKNWGIRPEFRWERQDLTFAGLVSNTNVVMGSASVFFQWGGRGKESRLRSERAMHLGQAGGGLTSRRHPGRLRLAGAWGP